MSTISQLSQSEPNIITSIAIAVGIVLIGLVVGRIVGRLILRLLTYLGLEDVLFKKEKRSFSIHRLLSESAAIIIYVIFFLIALNYLGVSNYLLSALGGIAILVIVLGLFLSLSDSLPNMIAYTKIARSFKPGDTVSIDSVSGKVHSMSILEVEILTKQGDIIHVPNRTFNIHTYRCAKNKHT